MARPLILIKPHKLKELHQLAKQGVPISYLVRTHSLAITSPTLSKLITYYDLYLATKAEKAKEQIWNSLFPNWLINADTDVMLQDQSTHVYQGKMPLGIWIDAKTKTPLIKHQAHSPLAQQ